MDTIENIITRIKKRASIPEQEERFGDDYFLELIKEETETSVLPFINSMQEEFFVVKDTITLDTLSSYPQNYIPIPRRSYARGVRQILWGTNGTYLYHTSNSGAYLSPEEQQDSLTPGFIFENDALKLVGANSRLYNSYRFNDTIAISYYHKVPNLTTDLTIKSSIANVEYATSKSFAYVTDATPNRIVVLKSLGLVNGQKVIVNDDSTINSALFSGFRPYYIANYTSIDSTTAAINLSTTQNGSNIVTVDGVLTGAAILTSQPGVKIYSLVGSNVNFPRTGQQVYDVYRSSTGAYLKLDCICVNTSITGTGYDLVSFTNDITQDEMKTLKNNQFRGFESPFIRELVLLPAELNCYTPLPAEVDNLLTSCVADRLLEALGDTEGRANNAQIIERTKESLTLSFGKRMVGAFKKVVPVKNKMRR